MGASHFSWSNGMPPVESRCQRTARLQLLHRKQPQIRNHRLEGFLLRSRRTKKNGMHPGEMRFAILSGALQEIHEEEMTEALGTAKSERTSDPAGLPFRLLQALFDDAGWRDQALRSLGSERGVQHRVVRALRAFVKRPAGFAAANVSALM